MSTSRHARARNCQGIHTVVTNQAVHFEQQFILWILFYASTLLRHLPWMWKTWFQAGASPHLLSLIITDLIRWEARKPWPYIHMCTKKRVILSLHLAHRCTQTDNNSSLSTASNKKMTTICKAHWVAGHCWQGMKDSLRKPRWALWVSFSLTKSPHQADICYLWGATHQDGTEQTSLYMYINHPYQHHRLCLIRICHMKQQSESLFWQISWTEDKLLRKTKGRFQSFDTHGKDFTSKPSMCSSDA